LATIISGGAAGIGAAIAWYRWRRSPRSVVELRHVRLHRLQDDRIELLCIVANRSPHPVQVKRAEIYWWTGARLDGNGAYVSELHGRPLGSVGPYPVTIEVGDGAEFAGVWDADAEPPPPRPSPFATSRRRRFSPSTLWRRWSRSPEHPFIKVQTSDGSAVTARVGAETPPGIPPAFFMR
jgi:hypothetical protein